MMPRTFQRDYSLQMCHSESIQKNTISWCLLMQLGTPPQAKVIILCHQFDSFTWKQIFMYMFINNVDLDWQPGHLCFIIIH
mmetsp:Transcript_13083/g.17241  ORF Transcript_13083/g.17241 Transcript_13083/m.17241 type:complete len:81 (+) Transcript_13083:250-492(+)